MRLIDADAFDKYLEGAEIEATKNRKYVFNSAINTIRGNLANFPTVNQWIPCSERLPEIKENHESDVVLCYCDSGAYAFSPLQENIFGQCGFLCERDDDWHNPVGEVIAWCPLPEPWKGEEE